MSDATQRACDAIADAITQNLGKNKADRADPADLKTLAEAASAIHFGPQGGDKNYVEDCTQIYNYDQHYTTHEGEKRTRPATGLGELQ